MRALAFIAEPVVVVVVPSPECQVPGADLEINPTLESLCLSMTEHALGGEFYHRPGLPHTGHANNISNKEHTHTHALHLNDLSGRMNGDP